LIGFAYGFPSRQAFDGLEPHGLHSHMLAVLPDYRRAGIGKQLKWFQRNWALAHGFAWITWTFDPLQAKNARLNLETLGATAVGYRIDAYGRMGGTLNAELPTDRLLALWPLSDPRVAMLASGGRGEPVATKTAPLVVSVTAEQLPSEVDLTCDASRLRIAIPEDIGLLMTLEPDKALRWRLTLRDLFTHYLARGYRAVRFLEGCYLLECGESASE
jgi:predicted GNAT superfamily acetyltransferase